MKYKVGDEVLIKAEITDVHEGLERPYFVAPDCRSINWVSEDKIIPMGKTYADGLNDAWELAKKIVLGVTDGGFGGTEILNIFGRSTYYTLKGFSCEEALAKIEAYEKEKEIKVGDVVCADDEPDALGVITMKDLTGIYVMWRDGSCGRDRDPETLKRTGKHIDIESLLRQIGE